MKRSITSSPTVFLCDTSPCAVAISSNNLQCLDFSEAAYSTVRIELISAPRLHTFKLTGYHGADSWVEYGDDLPRLQEAVVSCRDYLFPWPAHHIRKLAPHLQRLGLEIMSSDFIRRLPCKSSWLQFEKLRVLDLVIDIGEALPSFLECTVLLRAAPMLRELSVWFQNVSDDSRIWERRDLVAESSTWKHRSLEVLQLHGVHPHGIAVDFRNRQLELAAYIIMNAPSLNQIVINTRRRDPLHGSLGRVMMSDPIDARMCEAKMELETQLQGRSASPHINFTYQ
ncbi:unnamed protein product [Linum trigynum]|uniref:FBD domain-containing protein n=1 Tax=Linum trigynum TaxID=586398 RepID=A0AAV2DQI8_9ROSI